MDLEKIDWGISCKNMLQKFPNAKIYNKTIVHSVKYKGSKITGIFIFSGLFTKRLTKIELYPMEYPPEKTREGKEITDFIEIYNMLINLLGEPINKQGCSLQELARHNNVNDLRKGNYPVIIWLIGTSQIIHTFRDYWGVIPATYAVRRK